VTCPNGSRHKPAPDDASGFDQITRLSADGVLSDTHTSVHFRLLPGIRTDSPSQTIYARSVMNTLRGKQCRREFLTCPRPGPNHTLRTGIGTVYGPGSERETPQRQKVTLRDVSILAAEQFANTNANGSGGLLRGCRWGTVRTQRSKRAGAYLTWQSDSDDFAGRILRGRDDAVSRGPNSYRNRSSATSEYPASRSAIVQLNVETVDRQTVSYRPGLPSRCRRSERDFPVSPA